MNKILSPKINCIIFSFIYSSIGAILFYIKDNSTPVFFIVSFIMAINVSILWFYKNKLKEHEFISRKNNIIMFIFSCVVILIISIFFENIIEDSIFSLQFIIYISIPSFLSICNIALTTNVNENTSLLKYSISILMAPFSVFIVFNLVSKIHSSTLLLIILISAFYIVAFMIIHIIILSYKKNKFKKTLEQQQDTSKSYLKQRIITFMLAIFMPITGLYLNLILSGTLNKGGLFGDFSSPIFYLIAFLNGLLLLLPLPKKNKTRFLLFYLKSIGYGYILYFFIVFIPILPMGIYALIVGIGIYAFAPIFITIWQGKLLWIEFKNLSVIWKKWTVASVFILGIFTLPIIIFTVVINDKPNLELATKYIKGVDIDKDKKVNLSSLKRSLTIINSTYSSTSRSMDMFETSYIEGNIPIFSNLYEKFIAKNYVLSEQNINMLNNIFFDAGENTEEIEYDINGSSDFSKAVQISNIITNTIYDEKIKAYRTWIDLEMKNGYSDRMEFVETFTLPQGVYISDYYLNVFDEKKKGMLTDERAAIFIYKSIVRKRLDPGILHYVGENQLELRVFPFSPNELRKTGFEVIHKGNFILNMGGKSIDIEGDKVFEPLETANTTLLSSDTINKLPIINRDLQYNFIIDCSSDSNVTFLKNEVQDYVKMNEIQDANIYFTSYTFEKSNIRDMNNTKIKNEGGFNFNLSAKDIYLNTEKDKIPIIIAVTENIYKIVKPINISQELFPESSYYYSLAPNFKLIPYSFETSKKQQEVDSPIIEKAVSYNNYFVKNDGEPKLIILNDKELELTKNQFENAMMLYAKSINELRNSYKSSTDLIRKSFRLNVLTHSTAFIVVETEEQEKELLSLQEKILNKDFDLAPPNQTLSEPPMILVLSLAILGILFAKGQINIYLKICLKNLRGSRRF